MTSLTMTRQGGISLASMLKNTTNTFLALGITPNGETEWVSPPPDDPEASTLLNEIGRRRVTALNYVIPDPSGILGINNNYYTVVETPSNLVHAKFVFDAGDAANERVCQIGIFTDCSVNGTLPPGQNYFIPSEVTNLGIFFFVTNLTPFTVDPLKKLLFEFVISF